jgi:hypothetical protein
VNGRDLPSNLLSTVRNEANIFRINHFLGTKSFSTLSLRELFSILLFGYQNQFELLDHIINVDVSIEGGHESFHSNDLFTFSFFISSFLSFIEKGINRRAAFSESFDTRGRESSQEDEKFSLVLITSNCLTTENISLEFSTSELS